ncbi:MAG: hypothetical protein L3I99_04580 [Sulfurimonas sp.]|nr:hypothetical protein [Sulfurimonas sp.]
MKLTIDEYSKKFKMSKEMVTSKIRSKKLDYTIEEGITYIIVKDIQDINPLPTQTKTITKTKTTVATILALYKRENNYLKQKIEQLENKVDKLIDDKEQMLRDERDKIEEIYSYKDTQLKNILELVNAKIQVDKNETIHEVEHTPEILELKKYLKKLKLKSSQRKSIKKRFEKALGSDVRIIEQNGKLYLDFSKFDYSDLLAL